MKTAQRFCKCSRPIAMLASVALGFSMTAFSQDAAPKQVRQPTPPRPPQVKPSIKSDGSLDMPPQSVPLSSFLSSEARNYVIQEMTAPVTRIPNDVTGAPFAPLVKRQRDLFAVEEKPMEIGGVRVIIITPKQGVDARNAERVMLNIHGGGYPNLLLGQSHLDCFPACAELESIPLAVLGRIKVVSINYRQAPDFIYPTANEDVIKVYRELLKEYKPQNIGVYGTAGGGMLTASSLAWFQKENLPTPGAAGLLWASAAGFGTGDSSYIAPVLDGRPPPLDRSLFTNPYGPPRNDEKLWLGYRENSAVPKYLSMADPKDPLVAPINSPVVLAKFPPTLVVTSTRSSEMSAAIYTHGQLVKAGVEAELHVWDGLPSAFFYDSALPESKDVYNVMVNFFATNLAKRK